jgi:WD40 repeat protein
VVIQELCIYANNSQHQLRNEPDRTRIEIRSVPGSVLVQFCNFFHFRFLKTCDTEIILFSAACPFMPSFNASSLGLNQIKQRRKARGWAIEDRQWLIAASQVLDQSTDWASAAFAEKGIFAAGVSLSTWKRFLRGEPINTKAFKAFCQVLELDWEVVIDQQHEEIEGKPVTRLLQSDQTPAWTETVHSSSLTQDWGDAPDVPMFFGRTNEMHTLEQWILDDRCRLVGILGIGGAGKTGLSIKFGSGGMGKTNLSLTLAKRIQSEFQYVIWRSLLNAPPLPILLTDLVKVLSNQQELLLPDNPDVCLSQFLKYLKNQRCLIILDNVETILQGGGHHVGQYREGYEDYGRLLKQVGEVPHLSCLLLTSREKPKEIARLEGKTRPVRVLELGGLELADAQKIFDEVGNFFGSETQWQELIALYSGNPLALELVAKQIDEVFFGDIAAFLQDGRPVFHDLQELLDWHCDRLSPIEQEVANWLAINREPISIADLKADILSPSIQEQVPAILQSLQRRMSLECSDAGFTLQPVLMERITERLIQRASDEIKSGQFETLKTHALVKAIVSDDIRVFQQRLLMQPLITRLMLEFTCLPSLKHHLQKLLSTLKNQSVLGTGYTAGNLINILCALDPDLSEYDFSNLVIAQAYLTHATLQRTNFSSSTFRQTAFITTISSITAIAFSPDGQLLVTGEEIGVLRVWQATTGMQLAVCQAHRHWISSICFSPDGQQIATSSYDQTVRLWNLNLDDDCKVFQGHTNWVKTVLFSPDGQYLISSSNDRTIRVWDKQTGVCLLTLEGHTNLIWSLSLQPNGRLLASSSYDRTVKLWNLETGVCLKTFQAHTDIVGLVTFSCDGQTLISVSRDQTIRWWDIETGDCLKTIFVNLDFPYSIAINHEKTSIATGGYDGITRLWDIQTGNCLQTLHCHIGSVPATAFDQTGRIYATGGDDQTVKLWSAETGRNLRTLQGYRDAIQCIAFLPNRNQLVSGHFDSMVRVWDQTTGQCVRTLQGHQGRVWSVVYHAQRNLIASSSSDRTIRLWDATRLNCLGVLRGHDNWVWSLAINPTGTLLASGDGNNQIKLWQLTPVKRAIECQKTLQGHQGRVWTLDFNPDGSLLAAGSQDQVVKLWDVTNGACIATLSSSSTVRIWSAKFSPDGQHLACSGSDCTVSLWNWKTQECLMVFHGHTRQVWQVAFSPDGTLLASGSDDHDVRIWDAASGQCLHILSGHDAPVHSVAFEESIIASTSVDGTIRLWNIQTGDCLSILRASRPCEGMDITDVTGLTTTEIQTLHLLGAIADGHEQS